GQERLADAGPGPPPVGARHQRLAAADEADQHEADTEAEQDVARVAEGEDAFPPGQRRVVGMDDRVPRQPGQEEDDAAEPQPKEHPQSLGHGPTVRLRTWFIQDTDGNGLRRSGGQRVQQTWRSSSWT